MELREIKLHVGAVLLALMNVVAIGCVSQAGDKEKESIVDTAAQNTMEGFYVPIEKTVIKVPISPDVNFDDAIESMKLRANALNIKLVAELPLSKQISAMGESSRRIGIYQFCDALTAKKMVEFDINFAAYLPCRIALVEDQQGKGWLLMMNMDMLINNPNLQGELKKTATGVRDSLLEIINAGAKGEL